MEWKQKRDFYLAERRRDTGRHWRFNFDGGGGAPSPTSFHFGNHDSSRLEQTNFAHLLQFVWWSTINARTFGKRMPWSVQLILKMRVFTVVLILKRMMSRVNIHVSNQVCTYSCNQKSSHRLTRWILGKMTRFLTTLEQSMKTLKKNFSKKFQNV